MKAYRLALIIFALFLVSGCGKTETSTVSNAPTATAQPTATADEFAFARANYAKHCSTCHGDQGDGGLVTIKDSDKKLKVPSFKVGHALKHLDEDYVDQIENGGDGMPKFKDKLSADEIKALVRFIRHEFQGKQ